MDTTAHEREHDPRSLRISVLSRMDPASPRTHPIAALRLCTGLAAQGHRVELVVPSITRPAPPAAELFDTYGLDPTFDVRYLSVGHGTDRYETRTLLRLFGRHVLSAARRRPPTVVISDDIRFLLPYIAIGRLGDHRLVTAPWLHTSQSRRRELYACAHSSCVLATNSSILRDLESRGVSNPRTFITGNPVPQERVEFGLRCSKADARRRLGLDLERPVVAYTGKLYLEMRELDYLLTATSRMSDCLFCFTGGRPPVIEALTERLRERRIENVRLAGMLQRPEETRFYQQAADVLVTYYSVEDHPNAPSQLPAKLAEYMTTGNPIVAADFPATRDLLNPGNAILIEPHDVEALVKALAFALSNRAEAAALAAQAQADIAARTTESVGAELGRFLAEVSAAADSPGRAGPPP